MSVTKRSALALVAAAALLVAAQVITPSALADPDADSQSDVAPAPADGLQHNVTYRARADGTSRGAIVAYKADDANVNSEQPTLLPAALSRSTRSCPIPSGRHDGLHRLAVRIESALRDPGRRPNRRAGRSVHRAEAVPRQGRPALQHAAVRRPARHTWGRSPTGRRSNPPVDGEVPPAA